MIEKVTSYRLDKKNRTIIFIVNIDRKEKSFFSSKKICELNDMILSTGDVQRRVQSILFVHVNKIWINFLKKFDQMFNRVEMSFVTSSKEKVVVESQRFRKNLIQKRRFIRKNFILCWSVDINLETNKRENVKLHFLTFFFTSYWGYRSALTSAFSVVLEIPKMLRMFADRGTKINFSIMKKFCARKLSFYLFWQSDWDFRLRLKTNSFEKNRK